MSADRGSVTAFVVTMTASLVGLVGLVHDGGRLVAAHLQAADRAAGAARVGAQEVVGIRAGQVEIAAATARRRAQDELAAQGAEGTVTATPHAVTVTVRQPVAFELLSLLGLPGRVVQATRTAVVVQQ